MNKKLLVKTILFILLYVFLRPNVAQADYLSPAVNLNAAILQKSFKAVPWTSYNMHTVPEPVELSGAAIKDRILNEIGTKYGPVFLERQQSGHCFKAFWNTGYFL